MPAVIPFIPLIAAGITGGSAVAGGAIASHGASSAAKTQAGAATDALNFEKQQYAQEQERLKPYRELGGQAYAKLGKMFGLEPGASGMPGTAVPRMVGGAPAPSGGTFSFQSPQAGGTVKIRHPRTGEIRVVPAAQAEMLKQRGGQVVG